MFKFLLIFVTLLLVSSFAKAQTPSWLNKVIKIKPLITTEREIETAFGKPLKSYSTIKEYFTKEGVLFVNYSNDECDKKLVSSDIYHNVKRGTVIDISFRLKKNIKFKQSKLNLTGFEKIVSADVPGASDYKNNDLGIYYSLSDNKLSSINIFPSKDLSNFKCHQD